ncbi:MAG: hypothetical protein WCX69_04670 [Candidatus Paceibacterota bacterium]
MNLADILIGLVTDLIVWFVGLLPTPSALPSGVNAALTAIGAFFQKANAMFPIDTVFQIFGLVVTIEGGILAFKLGNWAFNKFRGAG